MGYLHVSKDETALYQKATAVILDLLEQGYNRRGLERLSGLDQETIDAVLKEIEEETES